MALPALIITGASGFVGRHLLDELKSEYRIFALARRSQHECGAPVHPNIAWMHVDIGDRATLSRTFREIATAGGGSYLIHLAAYYDFTGQDHREYERTNVRGTQYILELARELNLRRVIFASSVAACTFPSRGNALTEQSPPDGVHIYAWSKRLGEEMMRRQSDTIPACTVRFGAVYSDWCEYAPLYVFLETWLRGSWRCRILSGKGESAIPYIHIREIVSFFRQLLDREHELPPYEVLIASTDKATSHRELFEQATRSFFGKSSSALYMPRLLALPGLWILNLVGAAVGRRPFERPWMIRYLDLKLTVDATRTAALLEWRRDARLRLERRMPFLIERMKNEPLQWQARNIAILRRTTSRPDMNIYNALTELEPDMVSAVVENVRAACRMGAVPCFASLDDSELFWHVKLVYRLLVTSVQRSNRLLILDYFELSAGSRFIAGCTAEELCRFLQILGDIVVARLLKRPELSGMRQEIYDRITLPIEIGKDEIQEQYARHQRGEPAVVNATPPVPETGDTARSLLEETIWSCLVHRK